MTVEAVPWALNTESTDSAVARHALQGVLGGAVASFAGGVSAVNGAAHGVCTPGSLAVSQSTSPGMSVRVAAGIAFVTGTASALQGPYSFYNDTAIDVVTIAAADATNARKDLVCAQVRDTTYDASGETDARIFVVTGTPAASPVDPTPPASCLVLARVDVPALDTSITNAQITDLRTRAGQLALMSRPVCQVVTSGPPSIPSGGSAAALPFAGTDEIDPFNWHNPASNNTRVTPTIAGWYQTVASVDWGDDSDYTNLIIDVRRNGSTIGTTFALDMPQGDVSNFRGSLTTPLILLNGSSDYLELFVFQSNTSAGANDLNARFLVELVYPT
jgi:hypothetical protein